MCEPTTIAAMTLAVAAASAAASVKAQQDQAAAASAAADQQNQMNQRQRTQTIQNASNNNMQLNLQGQQNRDQTLQKLAENNRNASIGIGKATAAGGASGVGGNSVDALLGDLSGVQTRYNNSVIENYDSTVSALENDRLNIYANAANSINGLKTPAAVVQPDYISAGLKITQAGLNYASSTSTKSPKGT